MKKTLAILLLAWFSSPAAAQVGAAKKRTPDRLCYYTVPALSSVKRLPDSFPADGQLGGALRVVAARSEFEPASFVVFSPDDVLEAQLRASALTGKAGTIPAANIDLRIVKCWYQGGTAWHSYFADITGREMVPELLLHDENLIRVDTVTADNYLRVDYPEGAEYKWISNPYSVHVPFNAETTPVADATRLQPFRLVAGEFKQFWVTVKVPANAAAGVYRGEIVLSPGKQSPGKQSPGELSIPFRVRVLPFELPEPRTNYDADREFYTIVYNSPSYLDIFRKNGSDKAHADKKMLAVYRNMRDHNIRNPIFPGVLREEAESRYGLKLRNTFIRQLEILRDSGCSTDPLFGAIPGFATGDWLRSVRGVPLAEQKLSDAYKAIVEDAFGIVTKMFGHKNVYCFGWDEAPKWIVVGERFGWKYLHDKGVKVFSTGTDHHLRFAGYNQDFINCPGEPTRERAARWHAMGSRITNYAAPHTGPENPDFMRRIHGLQLFHANYDGIGNYSVRCTDWNDFVGAKYNFRRFNVTYPTRDGVLDTIAWEGIREAVDDVRYATKLKILARRAIATAKTDKVYAGRRALQWLELLDMKRVDLNTTRLEMVNRILALREVAGDEGKDAAARPKADEITPTTGDAVVARALLSAGERAKAEPAGAARWQAVLARDNVPAAEYAAARFGMIESALVEGDSDDAATRAMAAAADTRLSAGEQFTARVIRAGLAAGDLRARVAAAAAVSRTTTLGVDAKQEGLHRAAKLFMATRRYALARELATLADALRMDAPRETYECEYVENTPSSVDGWLSSDLMKDPKKREARFEPYDQKSAALLVLDVNGKRQLGDPKALADKGTAFYMAYDADGFSVFVECKDSGAEKVMAGLLSGGSLEMYFAPGASECYYQWFVRPGTRRHSTVSWSPPHRGYRPMDSYWEHDVDRIEGGIGVHVFIPWELVYDKLPAEGMEWPFNIVRWSRAGGMTWRGKVHDIHDFGVVRFRGLSEAVLVAIKRKIVLKGLAKYWAAREMAVEHWSDEVIGDTEFYERVLRPVIQELDEMAKRVDDTMTAADVVTLFENAVPDWMEFEFLVSELRQQYLADRMFAGKASKPEAENKVQIRSDFPGGNVVVRSNDGNTVQFSPDLRGGKPWFYWYFAATADRPGRVTFALPAEMPGLTGVAIGMQGPAVSHDLGKTWTLAGADRVVGSSFFHDFTKAGETVRLAVTIPYLQSDLHAFLATKEANPHLGRSVLTRSRKGRDVELLQIGQPGPGKKAALFTCRHHACETMASFVLEGFLDAAISDSPEAVELRKNYVIYVVPFVDKDGVEDGDQGKNRHPHDHNRDYGEDSLYPETDAIEKLADAKDIRFLQDLHCPTLRHGDHQLMYFVGTKQTPSNNEKNVREFAQAIKRGLPPKSPAGPVVWLKKREPMPKGSNCNRYFSFRKGAIMASTLEIPYAPRGKIMDARQCRKIGAAMMKAWSKARFLAGEGTR